MHFLALRANILQGNSLDISISIPPLLSVTYILSRNINNVAKIFIFAHLSNNLSIHNVGRYTYIF